MPTFVYRNFIPQTIRGVAKGMNKCLIARFLIFFPENISEKLSIIEYENSNACFRKTTEAVEIITLLKTAKIRTYIAPAWSPVI